MSHDRDQHVEALLHREVDGLLAYFTRRVRPVEDAADLLSETLLVLWRRAEAVPHDETAARMWAYGVARRVLATHRRGQSRRDALTERLRGQLGAADSAPERDPRVDALVDALQKLSETDREIVRLVHWEGFSLVEVAGVLGAREGTVRSRYHRARQRLRADLSAAASPAR